MHIQSFRCNIFHATRRPTQNAGNTSNYEEDTGYFRMGWAFSNICINSKQSDIYNAHVSMKGASMVSDNGLSPVRCRAIIGINTETCVSRTLGNEFLWNANQCKHVFCQGNIFENSVCQCVPFGFVLTMPSGKMAARYIGGYLSRFAISTPSHCTIWSNADWLLIGNFIRNSNISIYEGDFRTAARNILAI